MDSTVINSVVGTIGTIVVAYVGRQQVKNTIERRKRRRETTSSPEEIEAVQAYADDPIEFVHMVMGRLKSSDARVTSLEEEMASDRKRDRDFRVALARWVASLFDSWGHADEMPLPDDSDRDILADVIPAALEARRRRPRARPKSDEQKRDQT